MGPAGMELLLEDISMRASTEEGESVVPASVGDMKPSSRTSSRDAALIEGTKELELVCERVRVFGRVRSTMSNASRK